MPTGSPGRRRDDAVGALALLALIALAWYGALAAAFQFDDYAVIVDNPRVHDLAAWWASLPGIRPLYKLSVALNWQLAPTALAFHAANLAIHALNALLLWRLARHWLRTLAPAAPTNATAWLCAALFALHPATTEAITYASGRSISLAASFVLAALLADAHGRASGGERWRWIAPALFAAALATRETSLTVPFAIALFGGFAGDSLRATVRAVAPHMLVLAIVAAIALALPGYDYFFHWSLQTRDLGAQLLGQLQAHAHLFAHTLIGLRTNIDPDLRVSDELTGPLAATGLLIASSAMLAIATRRRWPWLGFGILWYWLQLAPSNSLLPRFDLANDRHLYLALIGPALIVAVVVCKLPRRHTAVALALALLLLCGGATWQRNRDYRSELTLWQATLAQSPGKARVWLNYGYALQSDGQRERAGEAYRCALALRPDYEQARFNLLALELNGVAIDRLEPSAGCPAR